MSGYGADERKRHGPREEVRRETPLQELGRPRRALLGWEELEAEGRVDVVERCVLVHAANDEETAVEDTDGRRVPPPLKKV